MAHSHLDIVFGAAASGVGAAGSKGVIGLNPPPSAMTTPLMEAGGGAYAVPETYQV